MDGKEQKNRQTNPSKTILQQLKHADPIIRKKAIEQIRELEDPSIIKPLMLLLQSDDCDPVLRNDIMSILSDARYSQLITEIAIALQNPNAPRTTANLLTIAWQSPLNIAKLLLHIIPHLAHEDITVAIEAATAYEIAAEHAPLQALREANDTLRTLVKQSLPLHANTFIAEMRSLTANIIQQKNNASSNE